MRLKLAACKIIAGRFPQFYFLSLKSPQLDYITLNKPNLFSRDGSLFHRKTCLPARWI